MAILLWRGYSTYWRNQRCSCPFQWNHGRSNPKRHFLVEKPNESREILDKKTQYFDYFRWVCNLQIAPRRRVFCQTLEKLNGFWSFTRGDHQFLRLFPAIHLLFQIWGPVTVHFLSFLPLCHQVLIFMPGWSHTKQGLVYTNKRKHRNSNSPPKKRTQLHIDRPGYRGPPNHFRIWFGLVHPTKPWTYVLRWRYNAWPAAKSIVQQAK